MHFRMRVDSTHRNLPSSSPDVTYSQMMLASLTPYIEEVREAGRRDGICVNQEESSSERYHVTVRGSHRDFMKRYNLKLHSRCRTARRIRARSSFFQRTFFRQIASTAYNPSFHQLRPFPMLRQVYDGKTAEVALRWWILANEERERPLSICGGAPVQVQLEDRTGDGAHSNQDSIDTVVEDRLPLPSAQIPSPMTGVILSRARLVSTSVISTGFFTTVGTSQSVSLCEKLTPTPDSETEFREDPVHSRACPLSVAFVSQGCADGNNKSNAQIDNIEIAQSNELSLLDMQPAVPGMSSIVTTNEVSEDAQESTTAFQSELISLSSFDVQSSVFRLAFRAAFQAIQAVHALWRDKPDSFDSSVCECGCDTTGTTSDEFSSPISQSIVSSLDHHVVAEGITEDSYEGSSETEEGHSPETVLNMFMADKN